MDTDEVKEVALKQLGMLILVFVDVVGGWQPTEGWSVGLDDLGQ